MLKNFVYFFLLIFNKLTFSNLETDFLHVQKGTIPVIITVPHGGTKSTSNIPERQYGKKIGDFKTFDLIEIANNKIFRTFNHKPYIVAAKIERKFIDFNRIKKEAYHQNSNLAGSIYDLYHKKIRQFIDEINLKFNHKGLLIDIMVRVKIITQYLLVLKMVSL
jgi:hypothetical protein